MRWFKHTTDERNGLQIKLLKKKYGAEGYGVYIQLLEIIGENVESDNFKDWGSVHKLHTMETLADECSVSVERFTEVINYCDEIGLFIKRDGRLFCDTIKKKLDDYAERTQKEVKKNSIPTKSEQSRNNVGTDYGVSRTIEQETELEQELEQETELEFGRRPEIKKGSIGEILQKHTAPSISQSVGIHTEWQEKAFRYAKSLNITLVDPLKGRWLKVFKQAYEGRKTRNIDRAYAYLEDYPTPLTSEQKALMFFKIYENGGKLS